MTSTFLAAGTSQFTTTAVTTAGFALGLALLITEHWRWYRGGGGAPAAAVPGKGSAPAGGGGRDPKALLPYWFGVAFGILMVACPSGLLGTGANFLRWGGNGAGGMVMSLATGQKATTIASASAPALDGYGATIVTGLILVLWWQRKQFAKLIKGRWKKGVLSGVLLCVSTGTAAIVAQAVVGNTNHIGHLLFGAAIHGSLS
jgi:hypothetical protein